MHSQATKRDRNVAIECEYMCVRAVESVVPDANHSYKHIRPVYIKWMYDVCLCIWTTRLIANTKCQACLCKRKWKRERHSLTHTNTLNSIQNLCHLWSGWIQMHFTNEEIFSGQFEINFHVLEISKKNQQFAPMKIFRGFGFFKLKKKVIHCYNWKACGTTNSSTWIENICACVCAWLNWHTTTNWHGFCAPVCRSVSVHCTYYIDDIDRI